MGEPIKGYKVFNSDWTCTPLVGVSFQYSCPGIFEMDEKPILRGQGFHFYKTLDICFAQWHLYPNKKIAEVIALGDVVEDVTVCCTNKIQIVQEISMYDVLNSINTGINNTGAHNNGAFNTGYHNNGDFNTGDYNKGHYNTGNHNNGGKNTGDYNIGDYNRGDFNKTNFSSGFFCTEEPKVVLFNKPTNLTWYEWLHSEALYLITRISVYDSDVWVSNKRMTDEEKCNHPEHEINGGYFKKIGTTGACRMWWDDLRDSERQIILDIPNFDAKIFKEITGIDVENY